jgi:ketosteroid isomerase-like protein
LLCRHLPKKKRRPIKANPFPFGAIQAKPEIVQQLEAINEKWDEAFNKHDAAAVAAFYTANAILVTPVGVSPVGTASRNSSQMCFSVGILPVN